MAAQRSSSVLTQLFARRRDHHAHARLDELCEFAPEDGSLEELVFWFVRLVAWVRPRGSEDARARVRFLRAHLDAAPALRERVAGALTALARRVDVPTFLAFGGIPHDFHLLGAVGQWLTAKVLPDACRTDDVERIVCLALRERDVAWLRPSGLAALIVELLPSSVVERATDDAKSAMRDLVHAVAAHVHGPRVRGLDADARSPFRGLYEVVDAFVASPDAVAPFRAVRGRIVQCRLARDALRTSLADRGADLETTFQLVRVERQLERLDLLAVALHEGSRAVPRVASLLAHAALKNARASHLFARSSELVLRNLVDTNADIGEGYLDERSSSLRASLLAGAGGGLLMGIATVIKFGLSALHLPPLYEGLVFSLNYAAAFCAAYLLHYTIATKLPAHTAAALARSVRGEGPRRERIAAFVATLRALVRTQLGGLVGNLVVTAPFAFVAAWAFGRLMGHPLVGPEKAAHVVAMHSVLGPSALYAALTGVFLWISSLAGAAADNWARVNGLAGSLATGVPVMKTVGVARAEPTARLVASRFGGLAGNALLGFLLGGVPAAFAIAQLPVDIRHVTVSSGSVAIAIAAGAPLDRALVSAVAGVLVIGAVNVAVSFALALQLALRASDDVGSSRLLARVGLRRALSPRRARARTAPLDRGAPPAPARCA